MLKKGSIPYKIISGVINNIRGNEENSRDIFIELKKDGQLETIFNNLGVIENYEILLNEFINILEKPKIEKCKYYKKYWLQNGSNFLDCSIKYYYELNAYFFDNNIITYEDTKDFKNFPLFFKKICTYYNKEPYASMEIEELRNFLSNYVDMSNEKIISPNRARSFNGTKESKLAEKTIYNSFNSHRAILVSEQGNGYGYDILTIDKKEMKETLIEVKTGYKGSYFRLSRLEHKVMLDAANLPNTEYLIYKCDVKKNSMVIYKYDKENNILVDINDENNICEIFGYMDYEREDRVTNGPRIKFFCIPKKLENKKVYSLK